MSGSDHPHPGHVTCDSLYWVLGLTLTFTTHRTAPCGDGDLLIKLEDEEAEDDPPQVLEVSMM